jgi:EAL domain-containing protein (putative c-di-GMP-specific phosphodiesterase class I)
MQAGTCGQRIVAALPLLWAKWVSLHDAAGRIHWHRGEVLGPPEREAMRVALDSFVGPGAPSRVNHPLQRDRTAVLLRTGDEDHEFLGFIMLVVDDRWLKGNGTSAPDLPIPVVRAVREWGITLASGVQPPAQELSAATSEIKPTQVVAILESGAINAADTERVAARVRSFEIELHSQSLTAIQSGIRIRRHEILLRDAGQPDSAVAPQELIRSAEIHGLGTALDRRVIGELVSWLAKHTEIWSGEPSQFSVNLTAASMSDRKFPAFVAETMASAGLPQGLLAFEAQHASCLRDQAQFAKFAAQLEKSGAGVVIDNYTLSEAGIDLLLQPGVRLVKLDPALTQDLVADRGRQARVAAIAQAARIAGVHVVAKQVECEEGQALMQALGVDFIQGFAAGMPAALDSFDSKPEQAAAG